MARHANRDDQVDHEQDPGGGRRGVERHRAAGQQLDEHLARRAGEEPVAPRGIDRSFNYDLSQKIAGIGTE